MDTNEALIATNDSAIKYATVIQEKVLDSVRTLTEPLKKNVPTISSWLPINDADSARGVLEETFAFNARMLDLSKSFAVSLLDVLTPDPTPAAPKKK
jgi:hypothetical protein